MALALQICVACLGPGRLGEVAAIERALASSDISGDADLHRIACGETCKSPARLWLQSDGGASYIFEGVDLDADRDDIMATLRCYLASPKGWIEDARPCGRLRFCLTARVPA
ncbi:DUF1636 domain-containing protein [Rhodobacteraceae bacterium]|nr:DUF1636 domain-containing protein [Paracoccaceae bacterium]